MMIFLVTILGSNDKSSMSQYIHNNKNELNTTSNCFLIKQLIKSNFNNNISKIDDLKSNINNIISKIDNKSNFNNISKTDNKKRNINIFYKYKLHYKSYLRKEVLINKLHISNKNNHKSEYLQEKLHLNTAQIGKFTSLCIFFLDTQLPLLQNYIAGANISFKDYKYLKKLLDFIIEIISYLFDGNRNYPLTFENISCTIKSNLKTEHRLILLKSISLDELANIFRTECFLSIKNNTNQYLYLIHHCNKLHSDLIDFQNLCESLIFDLCFINSSLLQINI